MGGEPTFVVDRRPRRRRVEHRRARARPSAAARSELVLRLRDRYGAGGFLHFGQGKWYPGEQLPRWALSICWRADGQPCWHDPALFADERDAARTTPRPTPQRFVHDAGAQAGPGRQHIVQAGYEDTFYYLWRERRLPVNVDPFDARLDDELERDAPAPRLHAGPRRAGRLRAAAAPRAAAPGWSAAAGSPARGSSAASACT